MAPRKNNKQKGSFFFFLMDFQRKQEAAGTVFRGGIQEVQHRASPHWNCLTNEEKKKYQRMAQEHRANKLKYTAQGVPQRMVDAEQEAKQLNADLLQSSIGNMLTNALDNGQLKYLEVYFISFAYFCETPSGSYIPAEMALVRYSLKDGVMDKLHMFIDPGKLPMGMAYDAQQHLEKFHKLPIPPYAKGVTDNAVIVKKLFNFLSQQEKTPLLFTENKDVWMVENILKDMLNQESMDENTLLVCPLSKLFYELKQATGRFNLDIETINSESTAEDIIEHDKYAFTDGISCDFHEEEDNGMYCPLSRCVRWAYTISDSCCLDLGIEVVRGRHAPYEYTAPCNTAEIHAISHQMNQCSVVPSSELTRGTKPKMHKPKSRVLTRIRGLPSSCENDHTWKKIPSGTTSISSHREGESSWQQSSIREHSPPAPARSSYDPVAYQDWDSTSSYRVGDRKHDRYRRRGLPDGHRGESSRSSNVYNVRPG